MGSIKLVEVEDVKLRSMQVEIKALTVSGKQVTLSLFKQIPERPCVDDDYNIIGTWWGNVNYFWKTRGDVGAPDGYCPTHHVLWQLGNTLYRCPIDYDGSYPLAKEVKDYARAKYKLGGLEALQERYKQAVEYIKTRPKPEPEDYKYNNWSYQHDYDEWEKNRKIAENPPSGYEEAKRQVEALFNEKYNKLEAAILALPQLYIAV